MRRSIAGLLAALMLAGCGGTEREGVEGAWIRLPAVSGRPAAAYFTLRAGDRPLTLVAVRTPAAIRTELHETSRSAAGVMSMAPLRDASVPAGGTLAFAPGGKHVMLFDVNPALRPGATTQLTFTLADGRTLAAPAAVRSAGDAAP